MLLFQLSQVIPLSTKTYEKKWIPQITCSTTCVLCPCDWPLVPCKNRPNCIIRFFLLLVELKVHFWYICCLYLFSALLTSLQPMKTKCLLSMEHSKTQRNIFIHGNIQFRNRILFHFLYVIFVFNPKLISNSQDDIYVNIDMCLYFPRKSFHLPNI